MERHGNLYRVFGTTSLGCVLAALTAFAQNGKIMGSVVDKESRDPLPSANVIIVGTTLGAAADATGSFIIFNVPPGFHEIKASFLGYQEVTVKDVRIVAGLTEEMRFELSTVQLEFQPITVLSQRPLLEKSATNAIRILKSDEFLKLPVRNTSEYLALQPGVILQDGRIHIRGSRPDEVGYIVEGSTTTNIVSRDGGTLVTTIPEAVEEVLVQAGGYTAEFGGASAGLVQQNLKTAREEYHISLQWESDKFVRRGQKFLDTYSYGYTNWVLTFSGPTINDQARLYLAAENSFVRDFDPTFWTGTPPQWSDGTPFGTVFDSGNRGGTKGESRVISLRPGNIPARFQNRYSLNGTLLLDVEPVRMRIGGALTWQRTRPNTDPIGNLFNQERLALTDLSQAFLNYKATHFLDPTTFVEASVSSLDRRFKTYDPVFKDDILAYSDSLAAAQYGWAYFLYTTQPLPYDFYGFPFNRPGTRVTGYRKGQTSYWGGSISFTSQMRSHELKIGAAYERWEVRNYGFLGTGNTFVYNQLLKDLRRNPDLARNQQALVSYVRRYGTPDNYGFDELGRPVESGPDRPKHPKFLSAYVQDKIELGDLIINAGIRFDRIDMSTWSLKDPTNPRRDDSSATILDLTKTEPFSYLLPRLGFSFPVADRTVFHIQYGKFVQAPGLDVAYRGLGRASFVLGAGATAFFADPIAYNLEPIKTTQYEVGFTQQFTDFAAFDVTAFYKDIQGQVQYDYITTVPGSDPSRYPVYVNGDFATTKGLELQLTLRRTRRLQAQLNYTFADAQGTNSFPTSARGAILANGFKPTAVTPLVYDQTHRGSLNLDYRFTTGDGGPILENVGLNVLLTFNSGHPYTKAKLLQTVTDPSLGTISSEGGGDEPLESINASTTPWNFNLNVRLEKMIELFDFDLNLYVYVQNLLNRKNITNVYLTTGNAFEDGFLIDPANQSVIEFNGGARYVDLYRLINLGNRRHHILTNGEDLFGTPRQIRVGLRIER